MLTVKIKSNIIFGMYVLATTLLVSCQFNGAKVEIGNSLWDGRTLAGWEGDETMFRIEEGVIKAGTLHDKITHNYFLCTKKYYDNFELSLQARVEGDYVNAGIQFRSERIPNHHEVIGYQCDIGEIESGSVWAALYDESRRNKFLLDPNSNLIGRAYNMLGWNKMMIRANHSHIQTFLNDQLIVDYTEQEDTIPENGIICLQIHSGPPGEAWYKDIVINEL